MPSPHHQSKHYNTIPSLDDDQDLFIFSEEGNASTPSFPWPQAPAPITENDIPAKEYEEDKSYSAQLVEQFEEMKRTQPQMAALIAGLFLAPERENYPSGSPNGSPSPPPLSQNTYGNGLANFMAHHEAISSPLGSPLAPVPSGMLPVAQSSPPPATTGSRSQKLYNCTICRRMFDRYSRARDCQNLDLGLTPHRCLGECGAIGCPVAYGSEALLLEHIQPRTVVCSQCSKEISKKNKARHQKEFCPRRHLAASSTFAAEHANQGRKNTRE